MLGWFDMPVKIALGIALAGLMTRILHLIGL